jgi:ketosteroid isomerase-like protein
MFAKGLMRPFMSMVLASGVMSAAWAAKGMSADEKAIRALEEQQVAAVLAEDIPTLERLWAEEMIVNNPQNGITPTRNDVLDRVRRGLIRYSSFKYQIEAIRFSGDIAIVMGSETVVRIGAMATGTQPVHRRYTTIWQKSGSTWRAIARHASVVAEK